MKKLEMDEKLIEKRIIDVLEILDGMHTAEALAVISYVVLDLTNALLEQYDDAAVDIGHWLSGLVDDVSKLGNFDVEEQVAN